MDTQPPQPTSPRRNDSSTDRDERSIRHADRANGEPAATDPATDPNAKADADADSHPDPQPQPDTDNGWIMPGPPVR